MSIYKLPSDVWWVIFVYLPWDMIVNVELSVRDVGEIAKKIREQHVHIILRKFPSCTCGCRFLNYNRNRLNRSRYRNKCDCRYDCSDDCRCICCERLFVPLFIPRFDYMVNEEGRSLIKGKNYIIRRDKNTVYRNGQISKTKLGFCWSTKDSHAYVINENSQRAFCKLIRDLRSKFSRNQVLCGAEYNTIYSERINNDKSVFIIAEPGVYFESYASQYLTVFLGRVDPGGGLVRIADKAREKLKKNLPEWISVGGEHNRERMKKIFSLPQSGSPHTKRTST